MHASHVPPEPDSRTLQVSARRPLVRLAAPVEELKSSPAVPEPLTEAGLSPIAGHLDIF